MPSMGPIILKPATPAIVPTQIKMSPAFVMDSCLRLVATRSEAASVGGLVIFPAVAGTLGAVHYHMARDGSLTPAARSPHERSDMRDENRPRISHRSSGLRELVCPLRCKAISNLVQFDVVAGASRIPISDIALLIRARLFPFLAGEGFFQSVALSIVSPPTTTLVSNVMISVRSRRREESSTL
jgi:hypothetical protein